MMLQASLATRPMTSSILVTVALLLSICMTPSAASADACDAVVESSGTVGVDGVTHTSIQAAIDHYKAAGCNGVGGRIEIRAGVYLESVSIFGVLGAAGSPLEIVANAGMTLAPGSARGFEFRGSHDITLRAIAGAALIAGTNEPIAIQGGSAANSHIVIVNWDIHDNGGGRDSGCIDIASGNAYVRIENVLCRDNGSTAIHVGAGGPHEIVNNTIVRNDKHGILFEKGAIATAANNLIVFNGAGGGSQANITIKTSGGGPAADVTLLNNIAYGVDGDIKGPFTGSGNLDTVALGAGISIGDFCVNPAANDFHLKAGSPAIDVGLPISDPLVPPADFEGEPRFGNADVGYDELLPDLDLDGVPDFIDNCPPVTIPVLDGSKTYNPGQEDVDGDGFGNRCDTCWDVFNPPDPEAPDGNGDGRPDQTTELCPSEHLAAGCPVTNDGTCEVLSLVDFTSAGLTGTPTVPPFCQGNLRFTCRRDGVLIPQAFFYFSLLSGSIEVIPQGEPIVNSCNLKNLLPPAALEGEGVIECDVVFVTDIIPEDCDPGTSNCGEEFDDTAVFHGEVPAGTITVILDPNAPDNDEACSPGFFKNTLEQWPPTGLSPDDDFDTIFGTDAFDPDISLEQAIHLGGGDANLLARRGVSGLLSARHPGILFPLSPNQVIITVRGAIDDDPPGEANAAALTIPVSANSVGGCPLSSGS